MNKRYKIVYRAYQARHVDKNLQKTINTLFNALKILLTMLGWLMDLDTEYAFPNLTNKYQNFPENLCDWTGVLQKAEYCC